MRFLSLFAGVGGFDLGLEWAGWECVGQCEFDPWCRAVLAKHWPGLPMWEDVRDLDAADALGRCGRIDAIVGGFPCQGNSTAGKRLGAADPRHLWPEFARLVRGIRPLLVVGENVPGIRTTVADGVLADLEAEGYACWPLVVGARHVGAPHRRDRVWFVARNVADAARDGQRRPPVERPDGLRTGTGRDSAGVADAAGRGLRLGGGLRLVGEARGRRELAGGGHRWPSRPGEPQHAWEAPRLAEPGLGLAAHGLPGRLARRDRKRRLKALGNAVVPQVAEAIGRAINAALAAEAAQ